jgi:hypothetical protein
VEPARNFLRWPDIPTEATYTIKSNTDLITCSHALATSPSQQEAQQLPTPHTEIEGQQLSCPQQQIAQQQPSPPSETEAP